MEVDQDHGKVAGLADNLARLREIGATLGLKIPRLDIPRQRLSTMRTFGTTMQS